MPRTAEQILGARIGPLMIRVAVLEAENERLQEQLGKALALVKDKVVEKA